MDIVVAKARLGRMTASTVDPQLSDSDLDDLLTIYAIEDVYGMPPSVASWDGAWDLDRAASEGWMWKAGKVTDRFAFSSDVNAFQRQQIYDHCILMADKYKSRSVAQSLEIARGDTWDPVIGNL